jgi:hypothetical protein
MNAHVDRSITYGRTPQATSKTARYCTALLLAWTYCNLVVKGASDHSANPTYDPDVSTWNWESRVPESHTAEYRIWYIAAHRSPLEWYVFRQDTQVMARLQMDVPVVSNTVPAFAGTNNHFRAASAFERVEDGWLIGFNHGEFGGALYWFSDEGSTNYRVSDHRIVDLFTVDGTVYAIEGLAHLNESRGSLIAIRKSNGDLRWTAEIASILPSAPYAVVQRKDRSLLIS